MGIDYEELDLNEIRNEHKRLSQDNQGAANDEYIKTYVRMPERDGFVSMRILPRKKGQKLFCATRIHTLTNPTTGQKRTYHCPKEFSKDAATGREYWRGDCIICKVYHDTWQKSETLSGKEQENMQNRARELKPLERYYYNVIVRSEKDNRTGQTTTNVGPKIFSCGKQVHAKIMLAIAGDDSTGEKSLGDITHPVTGRDFRLIKKVVKSGPREYPNYDNSKFEEASSAGTSEELERWLSNLHDLTQQRKLKNAEELKHALRVHTGMVTEGTQDTELEEFRSGMGVPASASPKTPAAIETIVAGAEKVREESLTPKQSAKSVVGEDESLADDEFLKELEGI